MTLLPKSPESRTTIVMFLGFLLTVAILTTVCTFGFIRVFQMNEDLRNAAQGRSNKVSLIEDMQALTRQANNQVFLFYVDPASDSQIRVLNNDNFLQDFDFYRASFVALGISPEEKQLLERVENSTMQASFLQTQIKQSFQLGDIGSAIPAATEVLSVHRRLQADLERLLEFERTAAYREVADASSHNQGAFRTVLVLFCVALVASCLVAWVVMRMVNLSEQLLFKEKTLAEATLNSIGEGVITVNMSGEVEYINPVAEQLTGWRRTTAHGRSLHEVYRLLRLEDRAFLAHPAEMPEPRIMRCDDATHLLIGWGGKEYEIEDSASPIYDDRGRVTGAVLVFRDVTATQEMSRKLKWQAGHDALTGLANRFEFQNRLEDSIRAARFEGANHALLFLDLDRFKVVNDTCGHAAGDQLLCQVGLVIQNRIRESDMLARLGGDEFGVLLHACKADEAMDIARGIRNSIRDFRFVWQDKIFTVGVSIGVALIDSSGRDYAQIMRAADLACHAAKEGGRDRIQLYDPEQHALDRQPGMDMVAQIIRSLDDDLFCLYRQKIVGLQPHSIAHTKYEILLRMADKNRVLAPGAFLPVAERYGLMKTIDRWVVQHTFAFLQTLRERDPDGEIALYSINLSGATINDDEFLDFLRDQMNRYQVTPDEVCFEVTETVAISSLTSAAGFMRAAKDLGFKFALDDFGTGMSSFAYLKHLPVDYVKIDGAFVRDVLRSDVDHEIVDAIIRISRAMKIETIAEYVGDEQTMAMLAGLGVDYAQGYAVHKPSPVEVPVEFPVALS
jgi:diguanylate cyclase (GGDEF)-like protein/PAS domain S-box-containing protein